MTDTTEIKKNKGCLGAFGWLSALVLIGWAVAVSKDNAVAALVLVGAALLALPPVLQKATASLKPGPPKWSVALIPVVLAIIGISLGAIRDEAAVENPQDPVANVVSFQARYLGATQSCNAGFQAISDEALSTSPNLQRMYDLASTTQEQCRAARDVVRKLDRPKGLTSEESGLFFEASKSCDLAYILGEQAAGKLKTALDGGIAPSQVAAFREKANEAAGYRRSCDTQIAEAANLAVAAHSARLPTSK